MSGELSRYSKIAMHSATLRRVMSLLALLIASMLHAQSSPPPPVISTVAGGGPTTIQQLNGVISNVASTGEIGQIVYDSAHDVYYFTSSTFNRVFKYDPAAQKATVVAGTGFSGYSGDGGPALQATFAGPLGLALDPTNPNVLYVGDTGNNRIRRIDFSSGTVDLLSGDGSCNVPLLNYTDVPIAGANVCAPGQMAIDGNGILYTFDLSRRVVWRLGGGQARIIAGSSAAGRPIVPVPAGVATTMPLGDFGYIAADPAGQYLYLNETIGLRQLNLTTGVLSAPLDVSANKPFLDQFGTPTGFFVPLQRVGSPVVVDGTTGNVIYAIYEQGAASESIFSFDPVSGQKTFLAGKGGTPPAFLTPTSDVNLGAMNDALGELVSIAAAHGSAGTLVAARSGWIHSMNSLSPGAAFTTVLGNGFRSYCGDEGLATSACLDSPTSVVANPNGDGSFFIADNGNSVVRFVDGKGIIHSLVSPKAIGATPTSVAMAPQGAAIFFPNRIPPVTFPGAVLFTSVAKHQVFVLDPVTDTTTLYSGNGTDACLGLQQGGFCDLHEDFGLFGAQYNHPRGLVIDQFSNPFLAEPDVGDSTSIPGAIACLICDDSIVTLFGLNPVTFANVHDFGRPNVLALDTDGLLVGEKGAHKIQHLTAALGFNGVRTGFSGWLTTEVLNNLQLPLPNVTPFTPVGLTKVPGQVIAADGYNRILWQTTRPPNLGTCPQGASCIIPPPPPQSVAAFAGGGTLYQDNIPAYLAAFGFRQTEAGIFDPLDSLGEISSASVAGRFQTYITDRADNRIRMVATAGNRQPVADAGKDRHVPLDASGQSATVLLDGSASNDPDGDVLTYAWSENGVSLGSTAYVQTFLSPGNHTVSLTVDDGLGGTSTATVNINATPPVDLAITATSSVATVNAGDTVPYNTVITNNGPNDATGVKVMLPVAASTDFVSGSAPGGACAGPAAGVAGTITCPVGSLSNGGVASVSVSVRPHASGVLSSVFAVDGDQGDPDTSNNAATTSVTVNQGSNVQVTVNESIHVSDAVTIRPSVMVTDAEVVHISDAINIRPSVMLIDAEAIRVTDSPAVSYENTIVGTPVVALPDQNGQPSNVTVSFIGGVTASGFTSVTIGTSGPALPGGFLLGGNPALYYDVQTTAKYNAPIVVCVALNPMPFPASLLHFNSTIQQWENFTITPVPAKGPICAQVNSLSPFAVGLPSNHPPTANAGPDQVVEATSSSGASVTLTGAGSDPDNDPLSFTWSENGTQLGTGSNISVVLPLGVHALTLTISDGRGGTATSNVNVTVQDTTPPAITINIPSTTSYLLNQSVVANYSCVDTASGVASCVGPVSSGSNFATNRPGSFTFTVNATDQIGNASSKSISYAVSYNICLLYDPAMVKKSGSTYPIQLRLCDAAGKNVSSSAVVVQAVGVAMVSTNEAGVLQDAGNSNPDFDFRYDATLAGYIFNLKTTGYATGTYTLNFKAGVDPTMHSVKFQIR